MPGGTSEEAAPRLTGTHVDTLWIMAKQNADRIFLLADLSSRSGIAALAVSSTCWDCSTSNFVATPWSSRSASASRNLAAS